MRTVWRPLMERTRAARLPGDPLGEFRVWRGPPPLPLRARLRAYLNAAINETPLQRFLETNPSVLVRHLAGRHGRWVIPGSRLVSRFAPDFVIGEEHAGRSRWTLVELESPAVRLFTGSGDATRSLSHALSRIRGWRGWLHDHGRFARERLNLANVSANAHALILIGRHARLRPEDVHRRRQLETEHKVAIHTYDWLVDGAAETPTQPREGRSQLRGR
jgi:Domain of unknown function (DUF4263)